MEFDKSKIETSVEHLVSIIIPVFNGGDFLKLAIESALSQTWPHIEVIVVDDGSNDCGHTRAVAASFGDRIRFISKSNGGVGTALNWGLGAMHGKWFSWLSHDDLYHPRKVETQLRALLDLGIEDAFAFGDYDLIDDRGNHLHLVNATDGYDRLRPLWALFEGRINGCTILAPRALVEKAGGFHPALPTTQDYHLWFKLIRNHPLIAVPGSFVKHRVHDGQGSRSPRHLDEAGLLWSEMLDQITPEEMTSHAGSPTAFVARVSALSKRMPYAAARTAAHRMLSEALAKKSATLAWIALTPSGPAAVLSRLREAGLGDVSCIVADVTEDATASLALRDLLSSDLRVARPRAAPGLSPVLELVQAAGMGDYVILADNTSSFDSMSIRDILAAVEGEGADGWMPAAGGGLAQAFSGSVFTRKFIEHLLEQYPSSSGLDAGEFIGLAGKILHPDVDIPAVPEPTQAPPAEPLEALAAQTPQAPTPEAPQDSPAEPLEVSPTETSEAQFLEPPQASSAESLEASPTETLQAPGLQSPEDPPADPLEALPTESLQPSPESPQISPSPPVALSEIAGHPQVVKPSIRDRIEGWISPAGHTIERLLGMSGLVDRQAYLATYDDVRSTNIDPLLHYLLHGRREGRDPRPSRLSTEPEQTPAPDPEEKFAIEETFKAGERLDAEETLVAEETLSIKETLNTEEPFAAEETPDIEQTFKSGEALNADETPGHDDAIVAAEPPQPKREPARMLILHLGGGGTLRYAELVADHLRRHGERAVFVWGAENRRLFISTTAFNEVEWEYDPELEMDRAVLQLKELGVVQADILHTIGLDHHICRLMECLDIPYDVTFLDYFLVAESYHLLDETGTNLALGGRAEEPRIKSLLRDKPHPVVDRARRLLACSRDLAARLRRIAPHLDIICVAPPEPGRPDRFRVTPPRRLDRNRPLRVLLLGDVAPHKGLRTVQAVVEEVASRNLPVEFHIVGDTSPARFLPLQLHAPIRLYGRFKREALISVITAIRPDLAWFPIVAPETHGFVLSEAMLAGLPILARGLGAFRERLANREFTWVLSGNEPVSPETWLDWLLRLHAAGLDIPSVAEMPKGLPRMEMDFYAKEY